MGTYYFGIDIFYVAVLAILFLVLSIIAAYKYLMKKNNSWKKISIAAPVLTLALGFVFLDLQSSIGNGKAVELQNALNESYKLQNGIKFRKAMGDLAKENGVLVDANTSYLGKDIYLTYIKKSDWNKLSKIYSNM